MCWFMKLALNAATDNPNNQLLSDSQKLQPKKRPMLMPAAELALKV